MFCRNRQGDFQTHMEMQMYSQNKDKTRYGANMENLTLFDFRFIIKLHNLDMHNYTTIKKQVRKVKK